MFLVFPMTSLKVVWYISFVSQWLLFIQKFETLLIVILWQYASFFSNYWCKMLVVECWNCLFNVDFGPLWLVSSVTFVFDRLFDGFFV